MQQINLTINQTTPSMILYKEHSIAVNIPYQTEINHYLSHPPLSMIIVVHCHYQRKLLFLHLKQLHEHMANLINLNSATLLQI